MTLLVMTLGAAVLIILISSTSTHHLLSIETFGFSVNLPTIERDPSLVQIVSMIKAKIETGYQGFL